MTVVLEQSDKLPCTSPLLYNLHKSTPEANAFSPDAPLRWCLENVTISDVSQDFTYHLEKQVAGVIAVYLSMLLLMCN